MLKIEEKIKNVMANVFNIEVSNISEESSVDTLNNWNSLGHMNLILALEEEFGIQFKDEQVIEMNSFPLLVCTLQEILFKT